jgi:acyl carrier protein
VRSIDEVRAVILSYIAPALAAAGMPASSVTDDTDLRAAGLIDSLGFVQLLAELERRLGPVDLSSADPTQLTHVRTILEQLTGVSDSPRAD